MNQKLLETSKSRRLFQAGNLSLLTSRYDEQENLGSDFGLPHRYVKTERNTYGLNDSLRLLQEELELALDIKMVRQKRRKEKMERQRLQEMENSLNNNKRNPNDIGFNDGDVIAQNKRDNNPSYLNQSMIFPVQHPQYPYSPYMNMNTNMMPPFQPIYSNQHCNHCKHQNKKHNKRKHHSSDESDDSQQEERVPNKNRKKKEKNKKNKKVVDVFKRDKARARIRKIFFVVAFTKFVKFEAKRLSNVRKSNLKKFWSEKFGSQMNNIKNWFLEAFKESLPIIMQKQKLNLQFFHEKSENKRKQKQNFIMKVLDIGISKLQQISSPQKLSIFCEIIYQICFRNSFPYDKFWTAFELQQLCISEFYGFVRADLSSEKFLISVMLFMKILLYNMILQPHKFDPENFPKNKEPISTNMKVIGSVFYYLLKQIIEEYRTTMRDTGIYKEGNWLTVEKQFIVECSEPLVLGNGHPEVGEYISGLFSGEEVESIRGNCLWKEIQEKIRNIIERVHDEMCGKAKMMRKNLKYKLYY